MAPEYTALHENVFTEKVWTSGKTDTPSNAWFGGVFTFPKRTVTIESIEIRRAVPVVVSHSAESSLASWHKRSLSW